MFPGRPGGGRARPRVGVRLASACALALALAGCGSYTTTLTPDLGRLKDTIAPRDLNVFQPREPLSAVPVKAEDLIGPDGRCAFDAAPSPMGLNLPASALAFTTGPQVPRGEPIDVQPNPAPGQPSPAMPRVPALNMTECDVVRSAGYTDRVEIGANERGQRSVVLTYMTGPQPGVYRFVAGRLVSIERGPEPPPAPKPARPAKKRQKQAGG